MENRFWMALARGFLEDQSGQAITEYMLILGAAVAGAVAIARSLKSALDQGVLKLGGQLEKDLRSGRAPLNVWKN